MNDCTNAEMRDQLPDLLHDGLDASAREAVMAHLEGCVDCREELRLLGEVRSVIEARTPRVDLNYVIGALPKPPVQRTLAPAMLAPRRRMWADWRVAAAVTLIVAGGSSVALLSRDQGTVQAPVSAPATTVAAVPTTPAATPAESMTTAASKTAPVSKVPETTEVATSTPAAGSASSADASTDATLSNLSQSQLKALLQDIDNLKAVPVAEPEPVSLRVGARTTGDDIL